MTILDIPVLSRIPPQPWAGTCHHHDPVRALPARAAGRLVVPGRVLPARKCGHRRCAGSDRPCAGTYAKRRARLAIHPNCGTNYAVSGFVAGLLAWLGMAGAKSKRDKVERLPLVITLATVGLILSQPLGPKVQEHITTSGDPQGLVVTDVFPIQFGDLKLHRVVINN